MNPIIELKNISKAYKGASGELWALRNVNLCVEKGEFIAITGESGSGKSTLMNIIGCLDKQTDGVYYLNGENVAKLGSYGLARLRGNAIGFILQDANLIPSLTALENAALPLCYRGIPYRKCKHTAQKALESVGMSDRAEHLPNELSGGQRQRVAIARVIAAEPDIILADEPTGSLDSRRSSEITAMLASLCNSGITVIMITHDISLAQCAGRILTVKSGYLTAERADSDGT